MEYLWPDAATTADKIYSIITTDSSQTLPHSKPPDHTHLLSLTAQTEISNYHKWYKQISNGFREIFIWIRTQKNPCRSCWFSPPAWLTDFNDGRPQVTGPSMLHHNAKLEQASVSVRRDTGSKSSIKAYCILKDETDQVTGDSTVYPRKNY